MQILSASKSRYFLVSISCQEEVLPTDFLWLLEHASGTNEEWALCAIMKDQFWRQLTSSHWVSYSLPEHNWGGPPPLTDSLMTTYRRIYVDKSSAYLEDEREEGWATMVRLEVRLEGPNQPTVRCVVPEGDGGSLGLLKGCTKVERRRIWLA